MPEEAVSEPDCHPDLPPRRCILRGLPVRAQHERLDCPDVRGAEYKRSVEDGGGVRGEEGVEVALEEAGGAG